MPTELSRAPRPTALNQSQRQTHHHAAMHGRTRAPPKASLHRSRCDGSPKRKMHRQVWGGYTRHQHGCPCHWTSGSLPCLTTKPEPGLVAGNPLLVCPPPTAVSPGPPLGRTSAWARIDPTVPAMSWAPPNTRRTPASRRSATGVGRRLGGGSGNGKSDGGAKNGDEPGLRTHARLFWPLCHFP